MQGKSILAICPERQTFVELSSLLSQLMPLANAIELNSYPGRKEVGENLSKAQPWLCFVDVVAKRSAEALACITELSTLDRSLQIVALLPGNDSDMILSCLRHGASEFLVRPLTQEQVEPVFARLAQTNSQRGTGRIVCVVPVKGACGASTLAVNLAYQWKRLGADRTLLADLDPSAGTISFLLKLKSTYSFIDALSRAGTLDADLWKGMVSTLQGVDVLLSPESANDQSTLPDPTPVLRFCRQMYDNVTIDLGSAFGPWNAAIAVEADEVIVVTTNELPALRSAQRVLSHFDDHHVLAEKTKLVINRYSPDAGLNRDAVETALGQKVCLTVPSDYESVQRALVDGKPIPNATSFGKSLAALADQLGEPYKKAPAAKSAKSTASGSWTAKISSFWSRKK